MTKVAILGAGNFGFALAYHLGRKHDDSLDIHLYNRNPQVADFIAATHTHPKYYPTVELSPAINVTSDLCAAVTSAQVIVLCVISTALPSVLAGCRDQLRPGVHLVSTIKALDDHTARPLSESVRTILPDTSVTFNVLAGGTTGIELTGEQYLGATLACQNAADGPALRDIFQSPYLRLQLSTDVPGVQYAASFKNVIAALVGLIAGLGFTTGTQIHVLALASGECQRVALSLGAQAATFAPDSQCWGNDMVMSAISPDTCNRHFGVLLGEGMHFQDACDQECRLSKPPESVHTLAALEKLTDLSAYPLLHFLCQLRDGDVAAHEIIKVIENYPS